VLLLCLLSCQLLLAFISVLYHCIQYPVVAINDGFQDNRSGVLEMSELQKLWTELMTWQGVFHQFDKNDSGFIEVSELRNVFSSVG